MHDTIVTFPHKCKVSSFPFISAISVIKLYSLREKVSYLPLGLHALYISRTFAPFVLYPLKDSSVWRYRASMRQKTKDKREHRKHPLSVQHNTSFFLIDLRDIFIVKLEAKYSYGIFMGKLIFHSILSIWCDVAVTSTCQRHSINTRRNICLSTHTETLHRHIIYGAHSHAH